MLVSSMLFAQEINVTGTVVDAATGETVPFASIEIKGTTQGTSSDELGKFTISVDSKATLIISSVGFKTLEMQVNGRSELIVELASDSEVLEEAIVVGYGTAKKITSVVGSANTVRAKALENRPSANAADALQGQVAGMQVLSSSGEPSANVSIRIRGVNSINSSNTPLFILDGSPVSASVFTSMSSNDIESIVVLKDAASTAIYGSRAANGVVYITSKKGKRGEKPIVQIRGQYGFSALTRHKLNLMNTDEWFAFNELVDPNFMTPKMQAYYDRAKKFNIDTDWVNYFFNQTAPVYSVEANISGATEKTNYFLSLNQFDQTGTAPFSGMQRYGIRSNINTVITNWLKFGMNLGLTYQETQTAGFMGQSNSVYNPVNASNWYVPWVSPYEINEETGELGAERTFFDEMNKYNTYYLQELQPSGSTTVTLNGNIYEEITPVKGLTIRAAQGLEAYDWTSSSKALPMGPFEGDGSATEQFSRYWQATFTNTAEYKFSFAEKNNMAILIGQESIMSKDEGFGVSVGALTDSRLNEISHTPDPSKTRTSWSKGEVNYNSYFARLSYDYADRYFIDASYRLDGSSKFGKNNRYASFYSVGAMWNIRGEQFMQDADWLNDFRLKLSYGTTGNSGIPNYIPYGTVGQGGAYNGQASWGIANPQNDDLTWEVVAALNVGLTARMFDRWTVGVDFYHKKTSDMLMSIPYSYTTGHSSGWGNIGSMINTGVDFETNIDIVRTNSWYVGFGLNFNYNYNEITELFGGRDEFVIPNTGISYHVGTTYGELFYVLNAGVDPRDGKSLYRDNNGNLTKVFSDDYAQFTGMQRFAPWAGGFQINAQWKGLSVGADFSWVAGKYTINNDYFFLAKPEFVTGDGMNGSADLFDIWQTPGQVTDVPAYGEQIYFDTRFVDNASFLRLKNLQISYQFPEKLMKKTNFFQGIRVYAIGRNIWTVTNYRGYDPEIDSNLQLGNYPNSRQFTFGLELTF